MVKNQGLTLPKAPFTMQEFLVLNGMVDELQNGQVTKRINKRLLELGYVRRRLPLAEGSKTRVWRYEKPRVNLATLDSQLQELN